MNSIKKETISRLKSAGIEHNEALAEADLLIEFVSGYTKKDFIISPNLQLNENQLQKLNDLLKKRTEKRVPVQYLTQKAYFMGEEFYVDKNVLIPRPETELLVLETLKLIDVLMKKKGNISLIDVGTGSGCIPITTAIRSRFLNIKITASDISEKALEVAKKNANKHGVLEKINFVHSDLITSIDDKFDIIISNPPYIPISEINNLQIEVKQHEPHLALFAEDEHGIDFYKRLIFQSKSKINKDGYIAFELGINQAEPVSKLLKEADYKHIKIFKDLEGIERVIIAQY